MRRLVPLYRPPFGALLLGAVVWFFLVMLVVLLTSCQPKNSGPDVEAVQPARDTVFANEPVQMCAFGHRPNGAPVILVPKDSAKAAHIITECRPAFERWKSEQVVQS